MMKEYRYILKVITIERVVIAPVENIVQTSPYPNIVLNYIGINTTWMGTICLDDLLTLYLKEKV